MSRVRTYTITKFDGYSPAREPLYRDEEVQYTDLGKGYIFGETRGILDVEDDELDFDMDMPW